MSDIIGTTTDKGGAIGAGGCLAATTLDSGGTATDEDAVGYGIDLLQYTNLDASDTPNGRTSPRRLAMTQAPCVGERKMIDKRGRYDSVEPGARNDSTAPVDAFRSSAACLVWTLQIRA
jgi:hypothetical protein